MPEHRSRQHHALDPTDVAAAALGAAVAAKASDINPNFNTSLEVIVDPLAKGLDLAPFFTLMADDSVVKVFHAARQDIEIIFHLGNLIPHPIFDTQVAAMVCGFGESISYDQLVGRRFKTGMDLSGGQWQKIAIARAWMRDAQVMILDEPTAALDARSEFEVFQRFRELSHERTAVLISHRFSSVRMADRILVLAGGKVEASGSHEQLMARGGRYAELFELQAAGYR